LSLSDLKRKSKSRERERERLHFFQPHRAD
jgi:hypothetical protein